MSALALAPALALMLLVGLSLGLLGSGGSIITLPVLVYVAGVPASQAVGMSLVIVGLTAGVGAVLQGFRRGIHIRAAVIFAATGAAGAFLGAHLTHLVSEPVLLLLFGGIMLAAGGRLLRGRLDGARSTETCLVPRCVAAGLVVGLLTGFLGLGGGFLIVPALLWFAGVGMKQAVPTSLAVIAANSAGGVMGQLSAIHLPWIETTAFLGVSVVGMGLGLAWADRLSSRALQRAFAWVVVVLGVAITGRNAWLLLVQGH